MIYMILLTLPWFVIVNKLLTSLCIPGVKLLF